MLTIFPNVEGNCSSYVLKFLKAKCTRQSSHNNVFIFNFYICILSYPNTTCSSNHHHNDCMAICALGHTYVRLHVADIQKISCRYL